MDVVSAPPRADQLAASLAAVRGRIAGACAEAGRDPDDVRLVVALARTAQPGLLDAFLA